MAGKGVSDAIGPIKTGINVGQKNSEILFPQTKQTFKDYWSGDIAKHLRIKINDKNLEGRFDDSLIIFKF